MGVGDNIFSSYHCVKFWGLDRPRGATTASGLLAATPGEAAFATPSYLNGTVESVKDGDTLHLDQDGREFKIRFFGIDCPETDQEFGDEATAFTKKEVLDKPVTVRVIERDQYGRFVGEVFVEGQSINRKLAKAGLAWWYQQYAPGDLDLQRLAEKARAGHRGLWAQENPTPPWVWRQQHQ